MSDVDCFYYYALPYSLGTHSLLLLCSPYLRTGFEYLVAVLPLRTVDQIFMRIVVEGVILIYIQFYFKWRWLLELRHSNWIKYFVL